MESRRALLLAAAGAALAACRGNDKTGAAASGAARELPPLTFREGAQDLMLTWIDGHGTTHTDGAIQPIPSAHREMVRVLVADSDQGAGDPIYLADVSKPDSDGSYTARSFPRSRWEDEIDKRRRAPTDDEPPPPKAPPPKPPAPPPPEGSAPPPGSAAPEESAKLDPRLADVHAVVYGASWCGPCHQALAHLKKRGVKTTFKDIEKDPGARTEVRGKLETAHLRTGSIPVIDLGGRLLVGFSAGAIDDALSRLKRGTVL